MKEKLSLLMWKLMKAENLDKDYLYPGIKSSDASRMAQKNELNKLKSICQIDRSINMIFDQVVFCVLCLKYNRITCIQIFICTAYS